MKHTSAIYLGIYRTHDRPIAHLGPNRTRDSALFVQTDSDNMPCGAVHQSANGSIKSLADLNRANKKAYGLEAEPEETEN